MKYFMTGATGFVGGEVARQLRDAGHDVIALARNPDRARALKAIGVEVVAGDVLDGESMRKPMTGVDGVFHLAAWYKVGVHEPAAEAINVQGTRNVLELMRELEIPRGVYTSTLAIYSDTGGVEVSEEDLPTAEPSTEYERTKRLAHEVAVEMIDTGLPLMVVLPGVIYGEGDVSPMGDAIRLLVRGRLPSVPSAGAFCWAHVEDTARGHLLAMEKGRPGEKYILGGPVHPTLEVFKRVSELAGRRLPPRLSPGMLRFSAALLTPISRLFTLPPTFHPESMRNIAGATAIGSNEKARRELGFAPRSLDDGFPGYVRWQMTQAGVPTAD